MPHFCAKVAAGYLVIKNDGAEPDRLDDNLDRLVAAHDCFLAAGLAENVDEVLKLEGLTGPQVKITATGFERAAFWITSGSTPRSPAPPS